MSPHEICFSSIFWKIRRHEHSMPGTFDFFFPHIQQYFVTCRKWFKDDMTKFFFHKFSFSLSIILHQFASSLEQILNYLKCSYYFVYFVVVRANILVLHNLFMSIMWHICILFLKFNLKGFIRHNDMLIALL